MPKAGELTYYEVIGEVGRQFAVNKPFSDPRGGWELMQVGLVRAMLPPPPARVLECGCGTGWLSRILSACGYTAVGTDVSTQAIELAEEHSPAIAGQVRPVYRALDYEELDYSEEFDAVVFYDALHHAVRPGRALEGAYRALRPGGLCLASEPGTFHKRVARHVAEEYDVTEDSMPVRRIAQLGRKAGFRTVHLHPRMDVVGQLTTRNSLIRARAGHGGLYSPRIFYRLLKSSLRLFAHSWDHGLAILEK